MSVRRGFFHGAWAVMLISGSSLAEEASGKSCVPVHVAGRVLTEVCPEPWGSAVGIPPTGTAVLAKRAGRVWLDYLSVGQLAFMFWGHAESNASCESRPEVLAHVQRTTGVVLKGPRIEQWGHWPNFSWRECHDGALAGDRLSVCCERRAGASNRAVVTLQVVLRTRHHERWMETRPRSLGEEVIP